MRFPPRSFVLILVACLAPAASRLPAQTGDDSTLLFALMVTRHGIRSPLPPQTQALEPYAAAPWPKWSVPPGELTPHGRQQMTRMGEYYRARFIAEGLLSGNAATDAARVYFRSDSDQRTIETARGLAAALLPGVAIDPHARADEAVDPLFRATYAPVGPVDPQLATAGVLGHVGGTLDSIVAANAPAFHTLEQIFVGESGRVPAGKTAVLSVPNRARPGSGGHLVDITGALRVAESALDVFVLEYGEGMPMDQVGWGRATPERITQLMALHSLYFELAQGSSYTALAHGSNLASHILATIEQAGSGRANPQALGAPDQKLVVVVGHDSNIEALGGLLGLTWWLPGTQRNPVLPGGAMLFELRERRRDHQRLVCVSYVAQSLDQMRELSPLTLEKPPGIAPIFVPRASGATDHFGAPLDRFSQYVQTRIDPDFVRPDPN